MGSRWSCSSILIREVSPCTRKFKIAQRLRANASTLVKIRSMKATRREFSRVVEPSPITAPLDAR